MKFQDEISSKISRRDFETRKELKELKELEELKELKELKETRF